MYATSLFIVLLVILSTGCSVLPSNIDTAARGDGPRANASSGCPGCDNVREIRDAYASNAIRAESKYDGQRVRIGGKVESFSGSGLHAYAQLENGVIIRRVGLGHVPFPSPAVQEEAREWEEWLMSWDVGDTIEAECRITLSAFGGTSLPVLIRTEDCRPARHTPGG